MPKARPLSEKPKVHFRSKEKYETKHEAELAICKAKDLKTTDLKFVRETEKNWFFQVK